VSAIHEDYGRTVHGRGPSDRNFGIVFTAAFLFFGFWPLRHHRPVRIWCLALSGAFLVVTLIRPPLLHGLNRIWTKLGLVLGKVVNPIVTGLLFYLVFTPIAVVLRWMGKDLLRLACNRNAQSYWIQRNAGELSDMKNQF
jgi:Saxitoxin biosynthesis operon protein SxtJ